MRPLSSVFLTLILCACVLASSEAQAPSAISANINTLSDQIATAQSDAKDQTDEKGEVQDLLNRAQQRLDAAAKFDARAKNYGDSVQEAPQRMEELRNAIENLALTPAFTSSRQWPLTDLERLLAKTESELVTVRQYINELYDQLDTEKKFDIQARLGEVVSLPLPETSAQDARPVTRRANNLFVEAARVVRNSEIALLEQRQLSRAARLSILNANIELENRRMKLLDERVALLNAQISDHRQNEVDRLTATARRIINQKSETQDLVTIAYENITDGKILAGLIENHYAISQLAEDNATQSQQILKRFQSLKTQLESTDLSSTPEFGAALRLYRDQLINFEDARAQISKAQSELTQARLAQFQLETEEATDSLDDPSFKNDPERNTLLADKFALKNLLKASYSDYIDELTVALNKHEQLLANSKNYAELIDKHLLWMPSARPISFATFKSVPASFAWIGNTVNWQQITLARPLQLWIALVLLCATLVILYMRSRMITYIRGIAKFIGKVTDDRIRYSWNTLGITILLALPVPLLLLSIGFSVDDYNAFSNGVGRSMVAGALVYFVINLLRQSVKEKGLAEVHFSWSKPTTRSLKRHLGWFRVGFTVLVIVNVLLETTGTATIRDSLGRITFVAGTIVLAVFALLVIGGSRKSLASSLSSLDKSQRLSVKYLLIPLVVMVPLLIALLSVGGYHYTAILLDTKLIQSACLLLIVLYTYSLALRWISINERRYTLRSLKEQRERERAESKERKAANVSGDAFPEAIDTKRIDLQKISDQTKALLKMIVGFGLMLGLWSIWSDLFSSFQTLDAIKLYYTTEILDNVATSVPVTLWDLLIAVFVILVTYVGAKNIPGTLEVAFLSRMSLQQGTSYAVTSISRYLILIVGAVVTFHILGAQWSKVQWLVAALSVGLGFGLQEIVANFVSGIVLLFERPIRIGDTVSVGDQMGTVSKIRIRATTILDWDNKEVIIPNKNFITERLVNWTLTDAVTRRTISVGVAYGSDVSLTEKILLDIANNCEGVLATPAPVALFIKFGASSLDFELRVFIQNVREILPVSHRLHKAIDKSFKENNIEIAFPQQDIHFDTTPIEVKLIQQGERDT